MTTVALLGGSGRLGGLVLARLLARGLSVRALSHRGHIAADLPDLTAIRGDVHDVGSLVLLLEGAAMVVSTLGNADAPVPDVCASAIGNLLPLLSERGIMRIVSTTGSAARLDPEIGREHHWLTGRRAALMHHMAPMILDAEAHMRLLFGSALDWTVAVTGRARMAVFRRDGSASAALDADRQPVGAPARQGN